MGRSGKGQGAAASRRGRVLFAIAAVALAAVAMAAAAPAFKALGERYRIGIDQQRHACLPWRGYLVDMKDATPFGRGDLVQFVAEGLEPYFEDGARVHKFIAGVPGDRVVIDNDQLFVNGRYWDQLWLMGRLEGTPRQFDRAFTVPEGTYFVAGTTPNAYDGRYWGVIDQAKVTAHVSPLW